MNEMLPVFVKSVTNLADGINAWEFRRPGGGELPSFTAGGHIDLLLSNGLVRSYSLCNSQDERNRYVIAVRMDSPGRGGSKFIHQSLRAGDRISISLPRNHFRLVEDASHVLFLAGGIGITPIWSMVQRLESLGRSWELHYCTRTRDRCAFLEELKALEARQPGRVYFNFDHEPGGRVTDIDALIAGAPLGAHLYCCGPRPMLDAFEAAAARGGIAQELVHLENFSPVADAAVEGGFEVELRRSCKVLAIPPGQTILDVLVAAGLSPVHSCMQGVCGTCETVVLDGIPDHRDSVLTPAERASNRTMMICCSGSKSARLVLDI
jgi:ferredoxin-NADP reductase